MAKMAKNTKKHIFHGTTAGQPRGTAGRQRNNSKLISRLHTPTGIRFYGGKRESKERKTPKNTYSTGQPRDNPAPPPDATGRQRNNSKLISRSPRIRFYGGKRESKERKTPKNRKQRPSTRGRRPTAAVTAATGRTYEIIRN